MIPFLINKETSDRFPANDVAVSLSGELSGKTSEKMPEKTAEKTAEKTTEKSTEAIILQAMRSNPYITQKELAAKCGLTEDGVYYVVSKLRKSGVVKRVGGRKLGYWEVLG